jgi:hypothetical protein
LVTHSAFVGGGQVGFNYQVNPILVLGVEGFFDGVASNNNTGTAAIIPGIGLVSASAQPNWVSTLAGRIGFTGPGFDHWLFYAKGGGGWVQGSATINAPFATFSESRTITRLDGRRGYRMGICPELDRKDRLPVHWAGRHDRRPWFGWLTRSLLGTRTSRL